ncbi:MAG: type II toxin-antitoxin system PemK/MazF family toxin [Anaerolineaceae bacterium]|nr:type II toxin-antitoxin system PemK/MazF family toxin [Anaerolineaceae bacterium]
MVIRQGDVYWVQFADEADMEPRIPHPHVIIQQDTLNQNPTIDTVVVCALTTNTRKISIPGNVLLEPGEANLLRQSIVEVSKVSTITKTQLGQLIGTLSEQRVDQILAGVQLVQRSFFNR